MNIPIIYGLALLLFIIYAFKLDDKHSVIKVLSLFFGIYIILLAGKLALDYSQDCIILSNYTNKVYIYGKNLTGYHWDYDSAPNPATINDPVLFHVKDYPTYNYYCFNDTRTINTNKTFFKVTQWYFRIVAIYLIVFVFYLVTEYLKKVRGGRV